MIWFRGLAIASLEVWALHSEVIVIPLNSHAPAAIAGIAGIAQEQDQRSAGIPWAGAPEAAAARLFDSVPALTSAYYDADPASIAGAARLPGVRAMVVFASSDAGRKTNRIAEPQTLLLMGGGLILVALIGGRRRRAVRRRRPGRRGCDRRECHYETRQFHDTTISRRPVCPVRAGAAGEEGAAQEPG